MKILKNLNYNSYEKCVLDAYLPDENGFTSIIYFHGGGLTGGDKASGNCVDIAKSFASNGYGFISVNYRMYPDGAKFPDFLEDAADAVKYVLGQIDSWNGNGKIIISGQSAGAWISLMLCLNSEYLNKRGINSSCINGWIIDSAQTTSHFNILQIERGEHEYAQRIDELAPLFYLNEKSKFSKMLLFFYEHDMLCRPQQNLLFYHAVKAFNPFADIEYLQLPGGHCNGSCVKDQNGEYPFVTHSLKWLQEKSSNTD